MSIVKNILNKFKGNSTKENPDIFYSYYLFGLYENKPIWDWKNWSKCISILQPIIDLSPETPFIKTEQSIPVTYGKENQNVSYNKGGLRFGRMVWNDNNNEKWTTKYCKETNWTFFDTEIAFPTRSQCAKNGGNPDLFITVHNQNLTENEAPLVNQAISIHIGIHLIDESELNRIENSLKELYKYLNIKLSGKIKRSSSYKSELGIGYTDSFWDGTYGLLDLNELDFSENYKRYGIEKI